VGIILVTLHTGKENARFPALNDPVKRKQFWQSIHSKIGDGVDAYLETK